LSTAGRDSGWIAFALFSGGFISDFLFNLPALSNFAGHMAFLPVNLLLFFIVFSLPIWKFRGRRVGS
jgi:hypothetical protein